MPQRTWFDFRAIDQNRDVLTGVVGAWPGRVAAVVSGEDDDVIPFHQLQQLWQTAVEQLQRGSIASHVTAVAVGGVEINKVGEHDGVVTGFFHLDQGGVEQGVDPGSFHLLGDPYVGIDIGNLTDGNHFATLLIYQLFQHGWSRGFHGQIVTVTGTLELTWLIPQERTGNHTADVVATFGQLFTSDLTQLVQAIQAESLFMAGNLEH